MVQVALTCRRMGIVMPPPTDPGSAVPPAPSRPVPPTDEFAWDLDESVWERVRTEKTAAAPPQIPGYDLLGEMGRGGMGVVYRARHVALKRLAAIKVMLAGAYATTEELSRFRKEAEALARLQHPHIVQIYEVGESAGRPYLALEFVEGLPLDQYANGKPLPPRAAAELLRALAEAVSYAHGQGIIHRDLKPSNVMMARPPSASGHASTITQPGGLHPQRHAPTLTAAAPASESTGDVSFTMEVAPAPPALAQTDALPVPKLMDFGLAKQVDDAGTLTLSGMVVGTPQYMAPEQADGHGQVGPAADIYALGAILYDLLTGRPPFQAATLVETLRLVVTVDPIPPTRFQPDLPRDLETICLKCLHKEPTRRYATAEDLTADLRRFLRDEPILARPVGTAERFGRWCRRHPGVAALTITTAMLLMLSTVGAILAALWIDQARRRADENAAAELEARHLAQQTAQESQQRLVRLHVATGNHRMDQQDYWAALLWYAEGFLADRGDARREPSHRLRLAAALERCPTLTGACFHHRPVLDVAWDGTGRRLVTRADDGQAYLWEPMQSRLMATLRHEGAVLHVACNYDGTLVMTGSVDGTARLWDAATGQPHLSPLAHPAPVRGAAFSPDGTRLVTACSDGKIRCWNVRTGKVEALEIRLAKEAWWVGFSPDGKFVATADASGFAQVWDAADGRAVTVALPHTPVDPVMAGNSPQVPLPYPSYGMPPAFSPDGRRLVTTTGTSLELWDVATGQKVWERTSLPRVLACAWSPDGARLAVSCKSTGVPLLDAKDGKQIADLPHPRETHNVCFSPDGVRLATVSTSGLIHFWNGRTGKLMPLPLRHITQVLRLGFSPDGSTLLAAGQDGTARLWSFPAGPSTLQPYDYSCGHALRLGVLPARGATPARAISPDGKYEARLEGTTIQIAPRDGKGPLGPKLEVGQPVRGWCFTLDSTKVVTVDDKAVRHWDAATGKPVGQPVPTTQRAYNAQVTHDGSRVLVVTHDFRASVWDVRTGQRLLGPFDGERLWAEAPLEYRRDRRDVAKTDDLRLQRWAFSGDGKYLALGVGYLPSHALVLDVDRGTSFRTTAQRGILASLEFEDEGRYLALASSDTMARVWDARTGQPVGPPLRHPTFARWAEVASDGRRAVTWAADNGVRVWDVETGDLLATVPGLPRPPIRTWFSRDGRHVIIVTNDRQAYQWPVPSFRTHTDCVADFVRLLAAQEIDSSGDLVPLDPDLFRLYPERFRRAWRSWRELTDE